MGAAAKLPPARAAADLADVVEYIANPAGFWRIAEHNRVMIVEALSEAPEIDIPQR